MSLELQLKSMLVGSPFEKTAKNIRWLLGVNHRIKHPELWELNQEEKLLPQILERLLTRSSNVLDVGAHIGSFLSLVYAIASEGQHTAVEAVPQKAAQLKKKFPKARIDAVAISCRAGTATFEEDLKRPGFSKLADGDDFNHCAVRYEVPVTTLDNLDLGKIDLMKIDIEGMELAALQGGKNFIKSNSPIILFECGPFIAGFDRFGLYDYLVDDLSYEIFMFVDFLYDKGPLGRDEFRKCGVYPFRAFNFLALPR